MEPVSVGEGVVVNGQVRPIPNRFQGPPEIREGG